jgi:hypothetical protein
MQGATLVVVTVTHHHAMQAGFLTGMGTLQVMKTLPIPIPAEPMGKTHTGYPYLCTSLVSTTVN